MPKIPLIDLFVVGWFMLCWIGYNYYAARKSARKASLVVAMRVYRHEWFKRVLPADNRIAHMVALGSLGNGATFFASTAILILGGLVAMLGTTEQVMDVVADMPFVRRESEIVSQLKIMLLIAVFVYAFFKFTWSIRQYNFCSVLVGAAPFAKESEKHEDFVGMMTRVASYAAGNFNQGLRAYYFALAALTWFLHPWLFVVTTSIVVYILHEREFRSETLQALTQPNSVNSALQLSTESFAELRADAEQRAARLALPA